MSGFKCDLSNAKSTMLVLGCYCYTDEMNQKKKIVCEEYAMTTGRRVKVRMLAFANGLYYLAKAVINFVAAVFYKLRKNEDLHDKFSTEGNVNQYFAKGYFAISLADSEINHLANLGMLQGADRLVKFNQAAGFTDYLYAFGKTGKAIWDVGLGACKELWEGKPNDEAIVGRAAALIAAKVVNLRETQSSLKA